MNTVTLNEYRALIMQAERSAVRAAQTVLPRSGALLVARDHGYTGLPRPQAWWRPGDRPYVDAVLDLTDPGTAHSLLVALALALGLDPGAGSLEVRLHRHVNSGAGESAQRAWVLSATGGAVVFASDAAGNRTPKHHRIAPDVAAEPDPIKALVLAVHYVLEHP